MTVGQMTQMTVGQQLRHARTERKLSVAHVTAATKIQPWVLEALESDRLPELMSPVYVKGFLSTYARFLKLDPAPLVAGLRWPTPPEAEQLQVQQEEPPPAPAQAPQPRFEWPAFQLPRLQLPRVQLPRFELPRFQLPRIPLPMLVRVGQAVAVAGVLAAVVALHPIQQTGAKKAAAKPLASKKTASESAVKVQAAPKVAGASITPMLDTLKPPAAPAPQPVAPEPLELVVTANRTTWIKVRADGKLLTQQRLGRGANERWTAKKQFEVIVSKPSQVELTLNGQSISPFAIAHRGRLLITHRGVVPLPEPD